MLASSAHLNPSERQPFSQHLCKSDPFYLALGISELRKAAENQKYTQIWYKKEDSGLRQLPMQI